MLNQNVIAPVGQNLQALNQNVTVSVDQNLQVLNQNLIDEAVDILTKIPKICYKEECLHDIIFGQHFNRSELTRGYNGVCPECGDRPKAESANSKTSRSSLMKTHLFYNYSIYKYGQKYKPL